MIGGSLLPVGVAVLAIVWFSYGRKIHLFNWIEKGVKSIPERLSSTISRDGGNSFFRDVTTGLRDFDILANLVRYYLVTLGFLSAVFLIFTAFELWRFAGTIDGGIGILVQYLFFLLPFIYLQLAPSAAMIAILATFVIKSRQNEIVTWTAAGQSVYRLLVPCFGLMLFLGSFNFAIQELIAPSANLLQDEYRQRLRSNEIRSSFSKFWVAEDDRIYSFQYNTQASDNESQVTNLWIYEFADNRGNLQALYRSGKARWERGKIVFAGPVKRSVLQNGSLEASTLDGGEASARSNPFKEIRRKPSQLSLLEANQRIAASESDLERDAFAVAVERKWSTIVLPFVIALFTAPFALSLDRKGKAATVGYAVGLWLVFMAVTSTFEQFGQNGALPAGIAVWAPLALFGMLGVYLLSRVKT